MRETLKYLENLQFYEIHISKYFNPQYNENIGNVYLSHKMYIHIKFHKYFKATL